MEVRFAPKDAPDWFPVAMRLQPLFHENASYGRVVVVNHDQNFDALDRAVDEVGGVRGRRGEG